MKWRAKIYILNYKIRCRKDYVQFELPVWNRTLFVLFHSIVINLYWISSQSLTQHTHTHTHTICHKVLLPHLSLVFSVFLFESLYLAPTASWINSFYMYIYIYSIMCRFLHRICRLQALLVHLVQWFGVACLSDFSVVVRLKRKASLI